jgi:hypothetical protein
MDDVPVDTARDSSLDCRRVSRSYDRSARPSFDARSCVRILVPTEPFHGPHVTGGRREGRLEQVTVERVVGVRLGVGQGFLPDTDPGGHIIGGLAELAVPFLLLLGGDPLLLGCLGDELVELAEPGPVVGQLRFLVGGPGALLERLLQLGHVGVGLVLRLGPVLGQGGEA